MAARLALLTLLAIVAVVGLLSCATAPARPEGCQPFPPIPSSLRGAIAALEAWLPAEQLAEFKSAPEKEATTSAHFALGMGVRNCWGLWAGSSLARHFNSLGIYHPDDMSGIILTSLWRHLNHQPLRLEEQVRFYKEYWNPPGGGWNGVA